MSVQQSGRHLGFSRFDKLLRRFLPSVATLSRAKTLLAPLSIIEKIATRPFLELRGMPPTHLRARVGVGNRLIGNQTHALVVANRFWMHYIANGTVRLNSNLVDIGCGWGRIGWPLASYAFGPERFSGTYVGIDIDPELIAWATAHFPQDGRFSFHIADSYSSVYNPDVPKDSRNYTLPLADETQDFVFSNSLFTHLLEAELLNYVTESARVLRCGGTMAMTVFCMDHLHAGNVLGGRWTFQHSIGSAKVESLEKPEAAVAYTEEFLRSACIAAGFSSATVQPPLLAQSILLAVR